MVMFEAKVGYDGGNGHMFADQTQVFETEVEANDWIEFMFNMSSEYDMAEVNDLASQD
jgi:hypothetical protein